MRISSIIAFLLLLTVAAPVSASTPDGGVVTDAGTRKREAEDLGPEETIDRLRIRAHRLQLALDSDARLDVSLATLFTPDLSDDDAVAARVERLDRTIAMLREDYGDLDRVATASTATTTVDAATLQRALQLKTAKLERAFLTQKTADRMARVRANAANDALALEHAEAEARQRRAEKEAKAAEADHVRALEEALAARTENLKRIKNQRAAVARAMSELAAKDQALGRLREEKSEQNGRAFAKAGRLLLRIQRSTSSTAAPALLEKTSRALRSALDELDSAITLYREGFTPPELSLGERTDAELASDEEQAALEELENAESAYEAYGAKVEARELSALLLTISAWHKQAVSLDQARNQVLARLPARAKANLFSFSARAYEGARLEVRSIVLRSTARVLLLADDVVHVRRFVKDVVKLGATFWSILKVIIVALLALWIRRRGPDIDKFFEENFIARTRSVAWIHRLRFIQRFVQRFGRSLLFIIALHVGEWALGAPDEATLLDLAFTVIFWLSYYWLLRKMLRVALIWALRRGPLPIDEDIRPQVESSAFLVGRTFFITGLFLSLAAQILGPGVLYYAARTVLMIAVLVVAFILLRRWRDAIAAAYLERWPEGTIARLVESTSGKFYGVFVVLAAFVVVVARSVYTFVKRSALGFEHSRRALAFLFKMRLERRSDDLGEWSNRIDALPKSLVEAFRDEPVDDPTLLVDHYPGLELLDAEIARWKDGRIKGSFLIRATRGYGKTTWVRRAKASFGDTPVTVLQLDRSLMPVDRLVAAIAEAVGLDGVTTREALVAALTAGPRRAIVLEDLQHVILRTVDAYRTLDELMALIEATGYQTFWLATVHQLMWHRVEAAHPRRLRFRHEYELPQWTEEEIRRLVLSRAAAAKVEHKFDDVLIDASDKSAEAMDRAVEAYTRLIWDSADGSPRVSLHFWLRSLAPVDDHTVRVRLFHEPDNESLESLPEETKFIYAAIAAHERLSPDNVAVVLRLPVSLAEARLIRGVELGHLAKRGDSYELDIYWARTIVRFLRRKRVL